MEKISVIIREQSGGLSEPKTPSSLQEREQSRESTRQTALLLAQMAAGFPHQEFSPETAEVYQMAYTDLATLHGLPELQTALRAFLIRQKFFPHPAEVAEELEAMAIKKQQELARKLPPLGCPKCHDAGWADGWIVVTVNGLRMVKECDCLKARRAAKNGTVTVAHDGKAEAAGRS